MIMVFCQKVNNGPTTKSPFKVMSCLPSCTTHFPVHVFLVFHTNSRTFHCFQILLRINDRTSHFTSFAILEAGKEMAGKPWSNSGWLLAQEVRKKIFFPIFKIFFWISRRFLDCKLSSSFLKRYLPMHKFLRICNSSLDLTLFDDDLYKNCDLK